MTGNSDLNMQSLFKYEYKIVAHNGTLIRINSEFYFALETYWLGSKGKGKIVNVLN
jgi:hypothetical protein